VYVEIKQISQAEGLQAPSAVPDRKGGRHIKGTETKFIISTEATYTDYVEIKQIPQAEGSYPPRFIFTIPPGRMITASWRWLTLPGHSVIPKGHDMALESQPIATRYVPMASTL